MEILTEIICAENDPDAYGKVEDAKMNWVYYTAPYLYDGNYIVNYISR